MAEPFCLKSESSVLVIRKTMKLLAIVSLVIGVSVACSEYKPAGSQSLASNNSIVGQSPDQTSNASGQASNASGQASNTSVHDKPDCQLTLAQAPVINGLKLGTTVEEVLALFPGIKEDAEVRSSLSRLPSQFGVSGFVVRPARYESKEKFAGINQITFTLLDGRVSNFTVGYNGPEYSHVDKFVAKFTEGTNLPAADQWEAYAGMDTQLKTLKCTDFEIRVFAGGQGGNLNYVLMRDLVADEKLKERRKKAREKAAPETKPGQ